MKRKILKICLVVCFLMSVGSGPAFGEGPKETKENKYWDNGKVRETEVYNKIGDLIKKTYYREDGSMEQLEKYNKNGNKTAVAYVSSNGTLRQGADGWAAIKWRYQGDNIVQEGYYKVNGKLFEVKFYNEEGDLVDKRYIGDKDIDPSEEYNPMPTFAGATNEYYDAYGRKEGSTSVQYYDGFFPYWWCYDDGLYDGDGLY